MMQVVVPAGGQVRGSEGGGGGAKMGGEWVGAGEAKRPAGVGGLDMA